MKTKLFYLIVLFLLAGKNQAQFDINSFVEKIKHFDKFVHSLQKRQPYTTGYRLENIETKNYDNNTQSYSINFSKDVFSYNNDNRNTEWDYNMWNTVNNQYDDTQFKTEYTYTTDGKVESITYYSYDSNAQALMLTDKELFSYNNDGQLQEYISQNYNTSSSQFVNDSKETYSYAQSGDVFPNEIIMYTWDGSSWQLQAKGIVTYNAYAFTNLLVKVYVSGMWLDYMNFSRSYDTSNRLILELEQEINGGNWENSEKEEYTYTANGNFTQIIKEKYNWDTNMTPASWVLHRKYIYDVDLQTLKLFQHEDYYLDQNNNLVGGVKKIYSYNTGNNNEIEIAIYQWDSQNNAWEADNLHKDILTYDMNVPKSQLVLPNMYNDFGTIEMIFDDGMPKFDEMNHQLNTRESLSRASASGNWIGVEKKIYTYTQVTAVEENNYISAKVYPNPFKDNIHFEVDADDFDINIYGLDGKLLYQGSHQSNENINLSFIHKGIYIYKIKTGKGIASGQLIKK